MQNETTKPETRTAVSGQVDPLVIWLKTQWVRSYAKMIWDDLTPFGRATIWLPIWFMSFPVMLFALPILLAVVAVFKFAELVRLDKIPRIFFAR